MDSAWGALSKGEAGEDTGIELNTTQGTTALHRQSSPRSTRQIEHTEIKKTVTVSDGHGGQREAAPKHIQIKVEFKLNAPGSQSV
jgi:hypothetical protein